MKMITIGNKAVYSVLVDNIEYCENEDVTKVTLKRDESLERITVKGNHLQRLVNEVNEANKLTFSGTYLNNNVG